MNWNIIPLKETRTGMGFARAFHFLFSVERQQEFGDVECLKFRISGFQLVMKTNQPSASAYHFRR